MVINPPMCPICGDPTGWRCGLVFHDKWIHYRESAPAPYDIHHERATLATIVERTPHPKSLPAPPAPRCRPWDYQHEVLEIG